MNSLWRGERMQRLQSETGEKAEDLRCCVERRRE